MTPTFLCILTKRFYLTFGAKCDIKFGLSANATDRTFVRVSFSIFLYRYRPYRYLFIDFLKSSLSASGPQDCEGAFHRRTSNNSSIAKLLLRKSRTEKCTWFSWNLIGLSGGLSLHLSKQSSNCELFSLKSRSAYRKIIFPKLPHRALLFSSLWTTL